MQTIELNGRPLAVMGADCEGVEEFAEGDGFRTDLLLLPRMIRSRVFGMRAN